MKIGWKSEEEYDMWEDLRAALLLELSGFHLEYCHAQAGKVRPDTYATIFPCGPEETTLGSVCT